MISFHLAKTLYDFLLVVSVVVYLVPDCMLTVRDCPSTVQTKPFVTVWELDFTKFTWDVPLAHVLKCDAIACCSGINVVLTTFCSELNRLLKDLHWQVEFSYRVECDSVARNFLMATSDAPLFGNCRESLAGELVCYLAATSRKRQTCKLDGA